MSMHVASGGEDPDPPVVRNNIPDEAAASAVEELPSSPVNSASETEPASVVNAAEHVAATNSPAVGRIAAELASLAELAGVPLAEHAEVYQRIHGELQRALAEIDGA